jgi:hypothetical protein
MRARVKEWLWRYLPAELLSAAFSLGAAWLTFQVTGNGIKTALAGTWGGNIAYFGYILAADVRHTRREGQARGLAYGWPTFRKNVKALAVEFGIAEIADTLFIRPQLMYLLPLWLGNLSAGILVAKVVADVTFYIPAILSYEKSKKRLRKFH